MRRKKFIVLTALAALSLSACGKKEASDEDIGVAVELGSETAGVTENIPEIQTKGSNASLESFGNATINKDGSIFVTLGLNTLANEEERADTNRYKVTLPEYSSLKVLPAEQDASEKEEKREDRVNKWINGKLYNTQIAHDMPLQDGDEVTVSMKVIGRADETSVEEDIEHVFPMGRGWLPESVEGEIKKLGVGANIVFTDEMDSDSNENYEVNVIVKSATGKRMHDEITNAWVQLNYPEYSTVEEFVAYAEEYVKENIEKRVRTDDEIRSQLFKELIQNSKVEGLSIDDNTHSFYMAVEAAFASRENIDISDEAFLSYIEDKVKQGGYQDMAAYYETTNTDEIDAKSDFFKDTMHERLYELCNGGA